MRKACPSKIQTLALDCCGGHGGDTLVPDQRSTLNPQLIGPGNTGLWNCEPLTMPSQRATSPSPPLVLQTKSRRRTKILSGGVRRLRVLGEACLPQDTTLNSQLPTNSASPGNGRLA